MENTTYICVCVCVYICMYAYMYIYICMYTYMYIYICMYVYAHKQIFGCEKTFKFKIQPAIIWVSTDAQVTKDLNLTP